MTAAKKIKKEQRIKESWLMVVTKSSFPATTIALGLLLCGSDVVSAQNNDFEEDNFGGNNTEASNFDGNNTGASNFGGNNTGASNFGGNTSNLSTELTNVPPVNTPMNTPVDVGTTNYGSFVNNSGFTNNTTATTNNTSYVNNLNYSNNSGGNTSIIDTAGASPAEGLTDDGTSGGLQGRTTIEYRQAPLLDVLRHLGDAAKINLAISPEVTTTKTVTLRLTNVSYDVALKTILDLFGLGTVLENHILRIDSLANIKAQQQAVFDIQKDKWKTQQVRQTIFQLNFTKATELANVLNQAMERYSKNDERFKVTAIDRTNQIIVVGVEDALRRARALITRLDRRKPQVHIQSRIVEANNTVIRDLGVRWGTRFGFDPNRGISTGIIFPNWVIGKVGGAGEVVPSGDPTSGQTGQGEFGFTLGSINGMINIDSILKAYETEDLANVIASPSVTVQDNEPAHFDQTITRTQAIVVNGEGTTQSFEAKIAIDVIPLIAHDNTLELKITVLRETPTTSITNQGYQEKIGSKADTKLVVNNGETAIIGGLFQSTKKHNQGRIPLLGKIPIIGFLFRMSQSENVRAEVMVMITARILKTPGVESNGIAESGFSPGGNIMTTTPGSNLFGNSTMGTEVGSGFEETNTNNFGENTFGGNNFGGNNFGGNNFGGNNFGGNNFGGNNFGGNNTGSNNFGGNNFGGNNTGSNNFGGNNFGGNDSDFNEFDDSSTENNVGFNFAEDIE